MPNFMSKGYDANQVIRSVYDINKNALRVNIEGSLTIGDGIEVVIDHANDSIRLGDGTNLTTTTTVGPDVGLDVNIINPIQILEDTVASVNKYGEAASVPSSTETTIVSHTASVGVSTFLQRVSCSGQNIAEYRVKVNSVEIDLLRTNFGDDLNTEFKFVGQDNRGFPLSPGDLVQITVVHARGSAANFNSRIQLIEVS